MQTVCFWRKVFVDIRSNKNISEYTILKTKLAFNNSIINIAICIHFWFTSETATQRPRSILVASHRASSQTHSPNRNKMRVYCFKYLPTSRSAHFVWLKWKLPRLSIRSCVYYICFDSHMLARLFGIYWITRHLCATRSFWTRTRDVNAIYTMLCCLDARAAPPTHGFMWVCSFHHKKSKFTNICGMEHICAARGSRVEIPCRGPNQIKHAQRL